jgi:predicted transcriptional regulator
MKMTTENSGTNGRAVKDIARDLVDHLAPDATWDDLMYQIYVRQAIEAGLKDVEAGRVMEVSEIRARFGLAG